MAKINAFIARKKTSKAGKVYYAAPYGLVDLVGFVNQAGDIMFHYSEREESQVHPGKTQTTGPTYGAGSTERPKPKITPKPQNLAPQSGPPPDLWERDDAGPSDMPEF
ncbi:MAG: hypothetical protein V4708_12165 [Bacteroidota bacterium]